MLCTNAQDCRNLNLVIFFCKILMLSRYIIPQKWFNFGMLILLPLTLPVQKLHGIPVSAFYGNEHKVLAQDLIRFCFAKEDSTLEQAVDILEKMKASAS